MNSRRLFMARFFRVHGGNSKKRGEFEISIKFFQFPMRFSLLFDIVYEVLQTVWE